jgi:hypothetical protein
VRGLLERLAGTEQAAERARAGRALKVLELVGSADARRLLEELAGGHADVWLTREAQASLDRLARRVPPP